MKEPQGPPLRVKGPRPVSGARELAAGVLLFGPIAAYLFLGLTGTQLHFEAPALNRLAHGVVLLLPVVWSSALLSFPARLREAPDAIVDAGAFHALDRNWFQGALLLPALLVALPAVGVQVIEALTLPNEALRTSGWAALLFTLEAFGVLVFYGSGASMQTWLAAYDQGLQVGLAEAQPWERIRVRRVGGAFDVHVVGVRFGPLAGFRPSPEARARLERALAENAVPEFEAPPEGERLLKAGLAAGTTALAGAGIAAWWAGISALLVVPVVLVVGLWAAWKIERVRGLPLGQRRIVVETDA